jgi:hypothetical protein
MTRIEQRLGINAVLKRLAFHYLQKGVGSHAIEHHVYDEVVVGVLYDWHTPDEKKMPPQGGMVVEFRRLGQRVRWVEFGCHYTGGGGDDLFREV